MAFVPFSHFEIHGPVFDFIMNAKSGYIHCEPDARKLYFEEGRLIYASSESEDDNYPRILVERGKLTEAQYKEVLASLNKGESFGRKVREQGLVEPKDLAMALKLQVTRVVDSVTLHKSGEFEVHQDELPQRMPRLKIQTLSLIGKSMLRIPGKELIPELDTETNYRLFEDAEERAIQLGVPKDLSEVFSFLKEHEWIQAEALQEFFDWDNDYLRKVLYFLTQLQIVEQDDAPPLIVEEESDDILETDDTDSAVLLAAASEADALAEILPESEEDEAQPLESSEIYSEEPTSDDDEFEPMDHDTLPGKNQLKETEEERVDAAFEDEDITDYTLQEHTSPLANDEEISDPLEADDEEISDPLEADDEEISDPLEEEEDDGPSFMGSIGDLPGDESSFADLNEVPEAEETSFADLNEADDTLDPLEDASMDLDEPMQETFAPIEDFSGEVAVEDYSSKPSIDDSLDALDESDLEEDLEGDLEESEHDFSSLNQSIEEVTHLDDATDSTSEFDRDTDSLFPDELEESPSDFETGPVSDHVDPGVAAALHDALPDDDLNELDEDELGEIDDDELSEIDDEEMSEDELEPLPEPEGAPIPSWNEPTVTSREDLPDFEQYGQQNQVEVETLPTQNAVQDFDPDDLVAQKRPEEPRWESSAVDTNPMPVQDPVEEEDLKTDPVIMPDPIVEEAPVAEKKSGSRLPVLALLLLVIVAGTGYFWWQGQSTTPITPDSQAVQTEGSVSTPEQPAPTQLEREDAAPQVATTQDDTENPMETVAETTTTPKATPPEPEPVATSTTQPDTNVAANEPVESEASTPSLTQTNRLPEPAEPAVASTEPEPQATPDSYSEHSNQAIRTFQQQGGRFSLTVVVACQKATVDDLMAKPFGPDLHVFPRKLGERDCYMVTWGVFQTKEEALAARSEMPDELRDRKDPAWVVNLDRYL
jgi:septal ring-binding cell division protein DamX